MIPTIGIMIGAYIFTRMVHLISRGDVGIVVKVFAALTLLVAVFGCLDLITASMRNTGLGGLP